MISARRLAANIFSGVFTNIFRVATQLVMLPLMARLLGPSQLGLYAIALPLINFVLLLSDAGIGDSLAKEKSGRSLVWSSAVWGLLATAVVGCLTVNAVSHVIARLSNQPGLPMIILPLSMTLLLVAITIVPSALMMREGNLVPAAVSDTLGTASGAVIGVTLALDGFGVWSLVGQYLGGYAVRAVAYNVAQPFVPKLEFSARSLFEHSGMGGQILLSRLAELGISMTERSRISLKLGAAAVGSYANASQVGLFTSNSVGSPIWANLYFIALHRSKDEVAAALLKYHRLFALTVFPAATLFAIATPMAVPIMLGPKWAASTGPIMAMVLLSPFGNLGALHSAIYYAYGLGRYVLYGQLGMLLFRLIVVLALWQYGVLGLSMGLGLAGLGYYIMTNLLAARKIGVNPISLFGVVTAPLVSSAAAGATFRQFVSLHGSFWTAVLGGVLSMLVYAICMLLIDRRRIVHDLDMALAMVRRPYKEVLA